MSVNITDSSTFTSPIVAPADGDAATAASVVVGMQGLANRTKYLSDNLLLAQSRQFAVFDVSATGGPSGASANLTEASDPLVGYSVASFGAYPNGDGVVFPAIGWYLLNLSGEFQYSNTTNPAAMRAELLLVDASGVAVSDIGIAAATRLSASTSDLFSLNIGAIVEITSTSTRRVIVSVNNYTSSYTTNGPCRLSVVRLL